MGMIIPSYPSISIDMHKGMHDLVSHLIEVHGRRKIAFIRGFETSQDAEERIWPMWKHSINTISLLSKLDRIWQFSKKFRNRGD